MTNVAEVTTALIETGLHRGGSKPVVVEVQRGADRDAAILRLRRCGIPAYPTPERAAAALSVLRRCALFHKRRQEELEEKT